MFCDKKIKVIMDSKFLCSKTSIFRISDVFDNPKLSDSSKILFWYLYRSLNRDEFSDYSNEWYASKLHKCSRQICRLFAELESAGYIEREVKKDGMITLRRIWVSKRYSKI